MNPKSEMPAPEEPSNIVALPSAQASEGAPASRFSASRNFINRELSWLEFNRRVLEEAQDPIQPLIERVKFLTIFSSNLDEFFEIRVAGIKQQIESETSDLGPDGLSPTDTFNNIQRVVPRLMVMPRGKGEDEPWVYIYLASLIKQHIGELFPGLILDGVHAFRVTRNSDLYIDEEEAENLLRTIEQELRRSSRGNAVRLEVEADCPRDFRDLLLAFFDLQEADLYKLDGPLSMTHLMPLVTNDAFAKLKDRPFQPATDPALPPQADIFEVMRKQDILLHHPYESFDPVVRFIESAATDPQVLALKITLYRTSGDSPIVEALIEAANNGKQVTALVELRARFDEAANIRWARQLEEAGAHVVYGVVGLKTHCKALLVVRRDSDRLRQYVHLGTGNYHHRTARIYTDFSLLTSAPELTEEVAIAFNTLTGLAGYPGLKKLMVAPFDLSERLIKLIVLERDHARAGKPARIIAKLNSLVDDDIIEKLYEASCAGVKIDLIVRGICCLRPRVPGLSENIRVISIVGRFLEHSRVYYFEHAGQADIYLSSADWMPRNFYRRVEIAFPIDAPGPREEMVNDILPSLLNDQVKARELQPDGSYVRLHPAEGAARSQAQLHFRERSRQARKAAAELQAASGVKLIPIKAKRDQRKRA